VVWNPVSAALKVARVQTQQRVANWRATAALQSSFCNGFLVLFATIGLLLLGAWFCRQNKCAFRAASPKQHA
jgi:hypothetical protein